MLVFTAEEVWGTRFPEAGSVHLLEWPGASNDSDIDAFYRIAEFVDFDNSLTTKWENIRKAREAILKEIEPMRRNKELGSSLEANVVYPFGGLGLSADDFAEICIVSEVSAKGSEGVSITTHHKCGRCWRHLPEVSEDGALCSRCDHVVAGMGEA